MKTKRLDFNTEEYDKLSISELKRTADYWLRQYLLRTTENSNGNYWCPLKKRYFSTHEIQVCHYLDRGKSMHTRYDLRNCHLMSEQTNCWDSQIRVEGYKSKHHKEYEEYLKKLYGDTIIEELNELASNGYIFRKEDYIEIIIKLRNGVN